MLAAAPRLARLRRPRQSTRCDRVDHRHVADLFPDHHRPRDAHRRHRTMVLRGAARYRCHRGHLVHLRALPAAPARPAAKFRCAPLPPRWAPPSRWSSSMPTINMLVFFYWFPGPDAGKIVAELQEKFPVAWETMLILDSSIRWYFFLPYGPHFYVAFGYANEMRGRGTPRQPFPYRGADGATSRAALSGQSALPVQYAQFAVDARPQGSRRPRRKR